MEVFVVGSFARTEGSTISNEGNEASGEGSLIRLLNMKKPTKLEEEEYAAYCKDRNKMNDFWRKLGGGYEDKQEIILDMEQYTREQRRRYGRDLDDDDENNLDNGRNAVFIGIVLFFLLILFLLSR